MYSCQLVGFPPKKLVHSIANPSWRRASSAWLARLGVGVCTCTCKFSSWDFDRVFRIQRCIYIYIIYYIYTDNILIYTNIYCIMCTSGLWTESEWLSGCLRDKGTGETFASRRESWTNQQNWSSSLHKLMGKHGKTMGKPVKKSHGIFPSLHRGSVAPSPLCLRVQLQAAMVHALPWAAEALAAPAAAPRNSSSSNRCSAPG